MPSPDISLIRTLYRKPEPQVLGDLLSSARQTDEEAASIRQRAHGLIAYLRSSKHQAWLDRFLREYGLDTNEGIALLGLAEAYLRIPDALTADLLIQDKVASGDWSAHIGHSGSLRVDGATFGLVLTRFLVTERDPQPLNRLMQKIGEPAVRAAVASAMQIMGEQFVLGRDIEEGIRRSRRAHGALFRYSFDMLGEGARTASDAEKYLAAYEDAIAPPCRPPGSSRRACPASSPRRGCRGGRSSARSPPVPASRRAGRKTRGPRGCRR